MKKTFFTLLLTLTLTFSLSFFSGNITPEISAHDIIPDDIMQVIIDNPDITDEEIDALFQKNYNMTVDEYTEKREIELEEGTRASLEGDPEYDAYMAEQDAMLQRQYEENEALKNNPNLTNLKENINFTENSTPEISRKKTESAEFSGNIFEQIQEIEQKHLFALRRQINNGEESFLEKTKNSVIGGVLHIWGGIDHILFFLSLILVMRPFRQTLLIISAFTLAHSITLLLVGAKAIIIPSKIVEVIIAVSIVYSAVFAGIQILKKRTQNNSRDELQFVSTSLENHENLKHTLFIVFTFGLFHGMGFAEVFEKFQFNFSEYWDSLLLYNGGVEIGQIVLLLIFFPIIHFLHKKNWGRKFLVLSSFVIATLAVVWVFERI